MASPGHILRQPSAESLLVYEHQGVSFQVVIASTCFMVTSLGGQRALMYPAGITTRNKIHNSAPKALVISSKMCILHQKILLPKKLNALNTLSCTTHVYIVFGDIQFSVLAMIKMLGSKKFSPTRHFYRLSGRTLYCEAL